MHLCEGLCGPFDGKMGRFRYGGVADRVAHKGLLALRASPRPEPVEAHHNHMGDMGAFPTGLLDGFDSCVSNRRNLNGNAITSITIKVVRQFAVMTVIWGIVGMLMGVIIAARSWCGRT